MSDYNFGPALDQELAYRRETLRRDAATHRLARRARRAAGRRAPAAQTPKSARRG